MNFLQLYKKLSNQTITKLQKTTVKAIINGKELNLKLSYDKKGIPYFEEDIKKEP